MQDSFQAQVFGQRNDGIQQSLHALLGAYQLPGTVNKVRQKFVHSRAGTGLLPLRCVPDGFTHGNRLPRSLDRTRMADRLQQLHTDYASLRVSSMLEGWVEGSLCPVLAALSARMLGA